MIAERVTQDLDPVLRAFALDPWVVVVTMADTAMTDDVKKEKKAKKSKKAEAAPEAAAAAAPAAAAAEPEKPKVCLRTALTTHF
jgi:hypothetical protein